MRVILFKPLRIKGASISLSNQARANRRIPLNSAQRGVFEVDLQGLRSFFEREPAEKSELDYLRLPWVFGCETAEGHIDQKDIGVATGFEIAVRKREDVAAAALDGSAFSGRQVHQNVAHHARGDGEELSAALPIDSRTPSMWRYSSCTSAVGWSV